MYSSALKTHIVDAVRDIKNRRVEFRLDNVDTLYTANVRILNVGVLKSGGTGHYNYLLGGLGVIKSVFLMDGNRVLDQVINFADWAAFVNQQRSNDVNRNIHNEELKNALGFTIDKDDKYNFEFAPVGLETADNDDNATLYLANYLNFLKEAKVLPTHIFNNLRIIIDYTSAKYQMTDGTTATNTVEPVLVVDEVLDEQEVASMLAKIKADGVIWNAIESDQVGLANGVNNANYTINGFDGGKLVNRMLVQRKPASAPGVSPLPAKNLGNTGSTAMRKLKEQFIVNGSQKLPGFNGIEDNNQRLGMLIDTWGEQNMVMGGNLVDVASHADTHESNVAVLIGNSCYTGLVIGDRVDEIQYQMKRSTATDVHAHGQANKAVNINFFGEVSKGLVVKGADDYSVSYL